MTAAAYSLTGRGLALLGRPRQRQTVHIPCWSVSGGKMVFPVRVFVDGEHYAVYGKGTLEALEGGATPAWLELETWPEEDA